MTTQKSPILHVLPDKNSYIVRPKNKKVSFWEKKAPAGALSPSTVLLRGILSVYIALQDRKPLKSTVLGVKRKITNPTLG